jgi:hypothetical protein
MAPLRYTGIPSIISTPCEGMTTYNKNMISFFGPSVDEHSNVLYGISR